MTSFTVTVFSFYTHHWA